MGKERLDPFVALGPGPCTTLRYRATPLTLVSFEMHALALGRGLTQVDDLDPCGLHLVPADRASCGGVRRFEFDTQTRRLSIDAGQPHTRNAEHHFHHAHGVWLHGVLLRRRVEDARTEGAYLHTGVQIFRKTSVFSCQPRNPLTPEFTVTPCVPQQPLEKGGCYSLFVSEHSNIRDCFWPQELHGCPWPDLSPRFWPPEVLTPQSGCSVLAQRRSASFLTRFLHSE